jgi:hypothetical protein
MNKMLFAALMLSTVVANAELESGPRDYYSMKKLMTRSSVINVITYDNIKKGCEKESIKRGLGGFKGADLEACAFWEVRDSVHYCTVVIPTKANNDIIGHEMRHCFQGAFH